MEMHEAVVQLLAEYGPADTYWTQTPSKTTHQAPDGAENSIEPEIGLILLNFIRERKPQTLVELGTFRGYSTCYLLAGAMENGFGKVVTYDCFEEEHYGSMFYKKFKFPVDNLIYVKCDGVWNAPYVPVKIDFCFHDSSHLLGQTIKELNTVMPRMDSGGMICFHDALLPNFMETFTYLGQFFKALPGWTYSVIQLGRGLAVATKL